VNSTTVGASVKSVGASVEIDGGSVETDGAAVETDGAAVETVVTVKHSNELKDMIMGCILAVGIMREIMQL